MQGTQAWVTVGRWLEGPKAQKKQVAGTGDWGGVGVSEETGKVTLGLGEPSPREEGEGKSPR